MARNPVSRLLRRMKQRGREMRGESEEERIRRACLFEEEMLARGMSLDDLNYYTLPFHEDEACEALGDEELCRRFLEGARLWFEVTAQYGAESACELLGRKECSEPPSSPTPSGLPT